MIKTRLLGLLSHAKKYIVYTVLWQWLALLSQIVAVFTIANLLGTAADHSLTVLQIEQTAGILIVVAVVRFCCEWMGTRVSYLACVDVKRILREKIYEKMLRLGASYNEQVSSSEIVQVSTEGVEQLETYFGKYLPQLFYSLLAPVTLVCDPLQDRFKSKRSLADLCSVDPCFDYRRSEDRKKVIEQILEYLYRTW